MNSIIVISGHGNYATGLKGSIEVLAGQNEDIEFIDFTEEDNEDTLKEKFEKLLEEYKGYQILFVCDILGGTPFKTAVLLSMNNKNVEVTAGCNIGSIIEVLFQKDGLTIGELAELIVDTSKSATVKFKKNSETEKEPILLMDEGI